MPFCKSCHMPSCKLIPLFYPHHSRLGLEKHNGTVVQIYYAYVSKPTSDHAQHRRSLMFTLLHASKCNSRIWLIRHIRQFREICRVRCLQRGPSCLVRSITLFKFSARAVLLRKFPNISVRCVPANLKFLLWGLLTGLRGYASHGGVIPSRGLLPKVALGYPRYLTSTKRCNCYFFGLMLQYVLWSKVLYFGFFE